MPEQDVELVRRVFESFNRDGTRLDDGGQWETGDSFVDEPEVVPLRAALEGTTFKGPSAVEDFWSAIRESWTELRVDVDLIEAAGSGVLAVGTLVGRGRRTGALVETRQAWAVFLREGRIARLVTHPTEGDARRELRGE